MSYVLLIDIKLYLNKVAINLLLYSKNNNNYKIIDCTSPILRASASVMLHIQSSFSSEEASFSSSASAT